jgi:hypothetical protein
MFSFPPYIERLFQFATDFALFDQGGFRRPGSQHIPVLASALGGAAITARVLQPYLTGTVRVPLLGGIQWYTCRLTIAIEIYDGTILTPMWLVFPSG